MPNFEEPSLETQIMKSTLDFENLSASEESVLFLFLPTNQKLKGENACGMEFEAHQDNVGSRRGYAA